MPGNATNADPLAEGLAMLMRMRPLDGFDFDRWAQIRRDCTKLLKDYGPVIREFGWTVSDVFGYQPRGRGTVGLGVDLRGGTITRMKPRHVLIWRPKAGSSKWVRASGWVQSREMAPIWEGADVDGPVWHRPRNLPVPPPVAVQPVLPTPEPVEVPMLVMPPHVFAAFTGPSCAIH